MREIQDSDGASPRRAGGIFNRFAWARAVELWKSGSLSGIPPFRWPGEDETGTGLPSVDGGRLSCFGERSFSPGLVFI